MKILKKFNAIFDRILGVCAFIAAMLIILIMFAINYQIVMRVLGKTGWLWILELCIYGLLYIVLLGSAWLLKNEGHVSIDMVINSLKPRAKAALNAITSVLGAIICFLLIWWGVIVTEEHFRAGYYVKSVLEPPTWPILAVIPVGFSLLFIQFLRRSYNNFRIWIKPDNQGTKTSV